MEDSVTGAGMHFALLSFSWLGFANALLIVSKNRVQIILERFSVFNKKKQVKSVFNKKKQVDS